MIYEFECSCGKEWTEQLRIADRHQPSKCGGCGVHVQKREVPTRLGGIYGAADWDSAHYNLALGQGVRNNLHAKKEAKRRGMSEVGDESIDKLHSKFDNDRKKRLDYDISSITNLGEVRSK